MANRKISDLTALTAPATGDLLPIVDISEAAAADKNKKITIEKLFQGIPGNVGIGTSSPGDKLDVFGVIRATNTTDSNFYGTFSNPDGLTRIRAYGGGSSICFDLGTSEKARSDSSGRFLVGGSADSGGALLQVFGDRIRVGTAKTPASASATGTAGEICWDANYIYVCTATNTWKRTAIATW